ncbi:hypothetical protein GCM10012285_49360 [Streptomyces kronopolitis]|uniref:Uncharacterized protein n=1 Tax=Streptomyces kronopolitis TaxID=1612435 RepID=A0ABQ2JX26_9ACTN|nr:hypothetical protein GCM10012285_49360 [Streptomyces kronopolitis]
MGGGAKTMAPKANRAAAAAVLSLPVRRRIPAPRWGSPLLFRSLGKGGRDVTGGYPRPEDEQQSTFSLRTGIRARRSLRARVFGRDGATAHRKGGATGPPFRAAGHPARGLRPPPDPTRRNRKKIRWIQLGAGYVSSPSSRILPTEVG